MVLATLLVSAAVLGSTGLPPAGLPAATTHTPNRQAYASADRFARTTLDDGCGQTVDPTDDAAINATVDKAVNSADDAAANEPDLPASVRGTTAQHESTYEQARAEALKKGVEPNFPVKMAILAEFLC